MKTLETIEKLAGVFAERRETLTREVRMLHARIQEFTMRRRPMLLRLVDEVTRARDALRAAVTEAPELFNKPKTRLFHDIKVGWVKGKGVLDWEDEAEVLRLIKKHYPERASILIITTETPSKIALAQLPAVDLKRLGITITETGDQVLVKPMRGEIDRQVAALLEARLEEET